MSIKIESITIDIDGQKHTIPYEAFQAMKEIFEATIAAKTVKEVVIREIVKEVDRCPHGPAHWVIPPPTHWLYDPPPSNPGWSDPLGRPIVTCGTPE